MTSYDFEIEVYGRVLTDAERTSKSEHDSVEVRKQHLVHIAKSRAMTIEEFTEFTHYGIGILIAFHWTLNDSSYSDSFIRLEKESQYQSILSTQQIFQTLHIQTEHK